eukprot:7144808-Prorocentrum_lima.AAC.1
MGLTEDVAEKLRKLAVEQGLLNAEAAAGIKSDDALLSEEMADASMDDHSAPADKQGCSDDWVEDFPAV